MARRKGRLSALLSAVFRAAHSVPLVGFFIAALLAVFWWRLRADPSAGMRWLAVVLGVSAIFFAVVGAIGFLLILLDRRSSRSTSRRRRR